MSHHRVPRAVALAFALGALAAPTASAQSRDPRSPDARDAALAAQQEQSRDLRSPDARDAAIAAQQEQSRDVRSPDARDAAAGRGTFNAPNVMLVKVRQPAPGGLDWGDAGVGAGGLLALILLGGGSVYAVRHRRGVGSVHHATPAV